MIAVSYLSRPLPGSKSPFDRPGLAGLWLKIKPAKIKTYRDSFSVQVSIGDDKDRIKPVPLVCIVTLASAWLQLDAW